MELDRDGEELSIHFWKPTMYMVHGIGLLVLIAKAVAAGRKGAGALDREAPYVSIMCPLLDWCHRLRLDKHPLGFNCCAIWRDSPYSEEEADRALRAFVVACKRCWPGGPLKLCVSVHCA